MRPADRFWLELFARVTAYEVAACRVGDGELLSEAVDRYRRARPIVTVGVIVYVAGHLLRCWPTRIDLLSRLADWISPDR